jgi:DNA-binding transcriptional MerR regulator
MADKSKQEGLTRKEVAQRFGVSVSTIRAWQKKFGQWLEVETMAYGGGRQKATTYSNNDLRVFSIVNRLTAEGKTYEDIGAGMKTELASTPLELPDEEPAQKEAPEGESVALATYSATVARLQRVEGKLEAIEDERDYLRERVGGLEVKLDANNERFDEERERFFNERNQLQDKLVEERTELLSQLDEERQKSWLKKLFRQ